MKKLFQGILVILLLSGLSSCQKIIDRIFGHHHGGGGEPTTDCKITGISYGDYAHSFSYDAEGRLDSIIPLYPWDPSTAQRITFVYNGGRLSAMKCEPWPSGSLTYHQYGYSGDLITTDTITSTTNVRRIWLANIGYDSSKRINHETLELIYSDNENEQPFIERYYHYDADGNLLAQPGEPTITYDDHKSLLSTDKMLQFLAHDYSRNNPTGGTAYNSNDLPTNFMTPYNFTFSATDGPPSTIIPITAIEYACE